MYSCAITTFLLLNPKKTNKKSYECNCQKCTYLKYKKQYSPKYSFLKKIVENMERDIMNRKKRQYQFIPLKNPNRTSGLDSSMELPTKFESIPLNGKDSNLCRSKKEQDVKPDNVLINIAFRKKEYNFSNLFILFNRSFSRHFK